MQLLKSGKEKDKVIAQQKEELRQLHDSIFAWTLRILNILGVAFVLGGVAVAGEVLGELMKFQDRAHWFEDDGIAEGGQRAAAAAWAA